MHPDKSNMSGVHFSRWISKYHIKPPPPLPPPKGREAGGGGSAFVLQTGRDLFFPGGGRRQVSH